MSKKQEHTVLSEEQAEGEKNAHGRIFPKCFTGSRRLKCRT